MREKILLNLKNPKQLEQLYRTNRMDFKKEFSTIYPEIKGIELADFWYHRLTWQRTVLVGGERKEFLMVILVAILAGICAKVPSVFSIDMDLFFMRNSAFLIFPFVAAYFAWKNKSSPKQLLLLGGLTLICLIYINVLPKSIVSDSVNLAAFHLPLLLWGMLGVIFLDKRHRKPERQLAFIQFNGDWLVICVLLVISGGILTVVSLGLFDLIGFDIEQFFFEEIAVFILPAIPIIAAYLIQNNPQLVNKVAPMIAKIFSPLVLVMLLVYLSAIIFSGNDPYNDREFLLLFNILLIGVMALIFFSVSGSTTNTPSRFSNWILFILSLVTIIVNIIALSAILFRISEWGITPNRSAVLGANVLMFIHLAMVSFNIFAFLKAKIEVAQLGEILMKYFPVYFIWGAIVIFLFPFVFGFK